MLRVLVADDEAPIRDWLIHALERYPDKYTLVGAAYSGKQAFSMIEETVPDVVIADIQMPGMTGLELLQKIAASCPHVVFIILTNHADFTYARTALVHGAFDYLLKADMETGDLYRVLDRVAEAQTFRLKASAGYLNFDELLCRVQSTDAINAFWSHAGFHDEHPNRILLLKATPRVISSSRLKKALQACGISKAALGVYVDQLCIALVMEDDGVVDHLARRLYQLLNLSIGVGRPVESHDITQMINSARFALSQSFVHSKPGVWHTPWDEPPAESLPTYIDELYGALIGQIQNQNFIQAQQTATTLFNELEALPSHAGLCVMELCGQLLLTIEPDSIESLGYSSINSNLPNHLSDCKNEILKCIKALADDRSAHKSEPIKEIIQYIEGHYDEHISLSSMAKRVFLSPEYLSRLFKEVTGDNFSNFLIRFRLNKARELLQNSDMRISQVAASVGYQNHSYFSKIYKEFVGHSPEADRHVGDKGLTK